MAEGTSRVRALFEPWGAAIKSYLNGESCSDFATRKTAQNRKMFAEDKISPAQAHDYLSMLQEAVKFTTGYSGKCASIVAKELESFKGGLVAKR